MREIYGALSDAVNCRGEPEAVRRACYSEFQRPLTGTAQMRWLSGMVWEPV